MTFIVAVIAFLLSTPCRAAVPLAALDETARQFAVECASAASLSPGTATLHVAEFEPYIQSPSLEPAQALFRDVLLKHLLEQRYFSLLEGPDAAATARYLLKGKLVESDGGLIVSVNLLEPGMQRILVAAQRPIDVIISSPTALSAPAPTSVVESSPTVKPAFPIPPKEASRDSHSQLWTGGGVGYHGSDLVWSLNGVFRSGVHPWEAELEYGRFKHEESVDALMYDYGLQNYTPSRKRSTLWVQYLRLGMDYLYRIRFSGLGGRIQGHIKGGAGLGAYHIQDNFLATHTTWLLADETREYWRVFPRVDLGFILNPTRHWEVQAVMEYVIATERFGLNYHIGGPGGMFRLGYRFL